MSNLPAKNLIVAEEALEYIHKNDLFNPLVDVPEHKRIQNPYEEFISILKSNLGWAAKCLIGKGDFELLPFQVATLETLWEKKFPILLMSRGLGKSFLLAVYATLRACLEQSSTAGSKIVLVSASFRQTKILMETIESLIRRSPIIHACCENQDIILKSNDMWTIKIGMSTITALPLGDGQRIRGIRATDILADEFAAIPQEIFDVVVQGFASVNQNPVEKVRTLWNRKKLREAGIEVEDTPVGGNRIIRSGSASYQFNHFYAVYERYKRIIENKLIGLGSNEKLKAVLGNDISPTMNVDYRNHAIIQLPYLAAPDGYMDKATIDEASLRMSKDHFAMEYMAKFITDSVGFFKASAIESATPKIDDPQYFEIELEGDPNGTYVMGLDPARINDDFGLFILKVTNKDYRIVYGWKWEKKNFSEISKEIRRLYKVFNIKRIGIDQGGGGTAIKDNLQTKELIPEGEFPFWEIDEDTVSPGDKVLDMINYMGIWLKSANYDLAADIDNKRLLFPYCAASSSTNARVLEKTEEVFDIILECKNQLRNIEVTYTEKNEVEHFDVPMSMKRTAKKDLYSALLIAAYEARELKAKDVRSVRNYNEIIGGTPDQLLGLPEVAEDEYRTDDDRFD
jgi:hypothetical protein